MAEPLLASTKFTEEKELDDDTVLQSPAGTTFTVPKGWWVSYRKDFWVLRDPDRELVLALLENQPGDLVAAAEKGWKKLQPGFSRPVKDTGRLPAKNGSDEAAFVSYETTAAERRAADAQGWRKGETWWFRLLEGSRAAVDRRLAQIDLIFNSLKVPGVEAESFAGKKANRLDPTRLKALDRFMEQVPSLGRVGLAVAVVQDGRVVYEKASGVRELGTSLEVTPNSLFAIASVTKQFVTLLMARLVDKGVLDWETPVQRLLPDFRLGDPEIVRKLTLRNTVSMSTGIPYGGWRFFFQFKDSSPEEILASMTSVKPTTGFGETFQYCNEMVTVGGLAAAHAAYPELPLGEALNKAIQVEVFDPLGMKDSTFDWRTVLKKEHCSPHNRNLVGEILPIPFETEAQWLWAERGSGGIWSNLRDMERILLLEISKGLLPDGSRYLSEKNLLKRREPQVRIDHQSSYGLGLIVGEDYGVKVVHHDGGAMGFGSRLLFLPDFNVGLMILSNGPFSFFGEGFPRKIMELLFDGRERAVQDMELEIEVFRKQLKTRSSGVELKPDQAWLQKLVGDYFNETLGPVFIRLKGDGAVFGTDSIEWSIGRKVEKDGTERIVLTTPPWAGEPGLIVTEDKGRLALRMELGQEKFILGRVS